MKSHKLHNISDLECKFNVRSEFGNCFPSEYMYWDEARMQKSSANRFPKEDQVLIFAEPHGHNEEEEESDEKSGDDENDGEILNPQVN